MVKKTLKFDKSLFFDNIFDKIANNNIPNIDLHLHTKWTDGENTVKKCTKGNIQRLQSYFV